MTSIVEFGERDRLVADWDFEPSKASFRTSLVRAHACVLGTRLAPRNLCIRPVTPRRRWICYFIYAPDGRLSVAHLFTLARLRRADVGICVIFATSSSIAAPSKLLEYANALYWKDLSGFDFSAYALGLREIARCSPGADVLFMNDSVFGPFNDLDVAFSSKWGFTGFSAFSLLENHIQSYAFAIKNVTKGTVTSLRTVLPAAMAWNDYRHVVFFQETRLARVAARRTSAGAFWYSSDGASDPTLVHAQTLLENGFPFLKRSLFSRHRGIMDEQLLRNLLEDRGHPQPEDTG